jgi:hypothetical protein
MMTRLIADFSYIHLQRARPAAGQRRDSVTAQFSLEVRSIVRDQSSVHEFRVPRKPRQTQELNVLPGANELGAGAQLADGELPQVGFRG